LSFVVHHQLCSGCRACLLACSIVNFEKITTALAALRIEARFPRPGAYLVHLCDQCGVCLEACPEGAISWAGGGLALNEADCSACGVCVEVCPGEVISLDPDAGRPILCTGCGECAAICPRDAIELRSGTRRGVIG
jgi:anaerobic carbon-monoxide dehydrogenase iron sulfur subunit